MHAGFSALITPENSRADNRTTAIVEREDFYVISRGFGDGRHQSFVVGEHLPWLYLVPFPPEFCPRCTRGDRDASAVVDLVFRKLCSRPTLHAPVIAGAPVFELPPWMCP